MSADLRFPRSSRLLSPKEFRRVFDRGRSSSDAWFVVYALSRGDAESRTRLGLVISRRFGSAVARNRWRRRVREAFRKIAIDLPPGHDLVVLPARTGETPTGAAAEESLASVARRAAERFERKGPK